jgi:hypothetical protein
MSRTKLSNVAVGPVEKRDHIARTINETAQAYCGTCERYLTYHDEERANNYLMAEVELARHNQEKHNG